MNKHVKSFYRSAKQKAAVGVALAAGAGAASATVDTSGITTAMTDAGAAIALVGAAYVIVKVGTRVFKWVAAAL